MVNRNAAIALGGLAAWLLLRGKARAKTPTIAPPPFDDPDDPPDPDLPPPPPPDDPDDPPPSLVVAWNSLLRPTPTPGGYYKIVKGDNLTNVAARAAVLDGGVPTQASITAWMEAITRVRVNWVLYATDKAQQAAAVGVMGQNGEVTYGNITAAFLPTNDPWPAAIAQGELPERTIAFTRSINPNDGSTKVQSLGPATHGAKTFGYLYIPPAGCTMLGFDVTASPNCTPLTLFAAAGQDPGGDTWWKYSG